MDRSGLVHDEYIRNCKRYYEKQNDQSQIPRFFKIIFGEDCSEFLYLPPQFAPTVKHLVDQQIQIEDSCGQQWPVTLCQGADGSLVFRKGWLKFFLDHDLKEGEFLAFDYMGDGHFIVHIYGISACERIKFNNGRSSQNKRLRRDPESASPCEPFQKTSTTVASGAGSQNSQMQLSVKNANFEGLQIPPGSIGMEDINCMINREHEHQGQDMNILHDLSIFEMGNMTKHANNFEEALEPEIGHSHHELKEYDDKFEKVIDTRVAPCTESTEHSKKKACDTQMSEIHTNLVHGHSGDAFTGNFSKGLDTGLESSQTESMEQHKTMGHDYQISVDNSNEIIGSYGEIVITKFKKNSISKASPCAEITGNVFNFLHGCGKIAGSENTPTSRCFTSSISSSELKNPIETGKHNIKKEQQELNHEAAGCPMSSCGNEPNKVGKHGQVLSSVVKIDPDLSSDISPLASFSPFTAEVKYLSCLVLPKEISSVSRRSRGRARLKVVYLKDPLGRVWPVLHPDTHPTVSLTANWRKFCEGNNIKIEDKCRFEPENDILGGCRVDISHSS